MTTANLSEMERTIAESVCIRPLRVAVTPGAPPVFARCHTRLAHVCPSCSRLYAGDWKKIIRSGLLPTPDGTTTAADFEGEDVLFLTLTAPSFGRVHRVPKPGLELTPARPVRTCGCGHRHTWEADRGLAGVPLDPDNYKYKDQVRWNYALGKLWNATLAGLRRVAQDFAFAVVREWQARGVLHLHAILRVPAGLSPLLVARTAQRSTATIRGSRYVWGREVQCTTIADSATRARKVGYLAKAVGYSAKSFGESLVDDELSTPAYRGHIKRLDRVAQRLRCPRCPTFGPGVCRSAVHSSLGAHGSVVSVSRGTKEARGWSLPGYTRRGLREQRRQWAVENGYDQTVRLSAEQMEYLLDLAVRRDSGRPDPAQLPPETPTDALGYLARLWDGLPISGGPAMAAGNTVGGRECTEALADAMGDPAGEDAPPEPHLVAPVGRECAEEASTHLKARKGGPG